MALAMWFSQRKHHNFGKQFDLMIYPIKNLGIYGGYEYGGSECRMHLFNKIDNFLFEHLLGE